MKVQYEVTLKVTAIYEREDIGTMKTDEEFAQDLAEFVMDELSYVADSSCYSIPNYNRKILK